MDFLNIPLDMRNWLETPPPSRLALLEQSVQSKSSFEYSHKKVPQELQRTQELPVNAPLNLDMEDIHDAQVPSYSQLVRKINKSGRNSILRDGYYYTLEEITPNVMALKEKFANVPKIVIHICR